LATDEYSDFNVFKEKVDEVLKDNKAKISASEKNAILNAVSWYDADAEKVVKGTLKLSGDKLKAIIGALRLQRK
jgi:type I restriction enzyme M protein